MMPPEIPISSIQRQCVVPISLLWPCPHRESHVRLLFFYCSMLSSPSLSKDLVPFSVWVCRRQLCQSAWYAAASGLLRLPGWNLKALSATHRKPSSSMAANSNSLILTAPRKKSSDSKGLGWTTYLTSSGPQNQSPAGGNTDTQTWRGELVWERVISEREDRLLTRMLQNGGRK